MAVELKNTMNDIKLTPAQSKVFALEKCIKEFKTYDEKRKKYIKNLEKENANLRLKLKASKSEISDLTDIIYNGQEQVTSFGVPSYFSQFTKKISHLEEQLALLSESSDERVEEIRTLVSGDKEQKLASLYEDLRSMATKYSVLMGWLNANYPEIRKEFLTHKHTKK